jgi:hypothetical protein
MINIPGIIPVPPMITGSPMNPGVSRIEESLFSDRPGQVVFSNRQTDIASAVTVSDEKVAITDLGGTGGVIVKEGGVVIQGTATLTSSGVGVRKGPYSENPKSSRIFTYRETVLMESIPKQLMSTISGKTLGTNLDTGMDGVMPIITDISAGPLPHSHTISMKHVHRVDPAYLYRIPPAVAMIKGALSSLKQFFSA